MEQVFAAIPIMALVAYWRNNMPVQQIELEEVAMGEVSDEAWATVVGGVFTNVHAATSC